MVISNLASLPLATLCLSLFLVWLFGPSLLETLHSFGSSHVLSLSLSHHMLCFFCSLLIWLHWSFILFRHELQTDYFPHNDTFSIDEESWTSEKGWLNMLSELGSQLGGLAP